MRINKIGKMKNRVLPIPIVVVEVFQVMIIIQLIITTQGTMVTVVAAQAAPHPGVAVAAAIKPSPLYVLF